MNVESRICSSYQHAATALGFFLLVALQNSAAHASLISYSGIIDLDYTSSIVGAPKGTRYFYTLTLDGSTLDRSHLIRFNDIRNTSGDRGLTMDGYYLGAVVDFSMRLDPTSNGTFDPSGLEYNTAAAAILTLDVNAPEAPLAFPFEDYEPITEHFTVGIGVNTPGSPIDYVDINLWNTTVYSPEAQRQLWLDTSTPDNGFTLDDLFLQGLETLTEFRSYPTPQSAGLIDSVYMTGSGGTFASGRVASMSVAVPEPTSMVMWLFAVVCAIASRTAFRSALYKQVIVAIGR